jgi:hypothetical protein
MHTLPFLQAQRRKKLRHAHAPFPRVSDRNRARRIPRFGRANSLAQARLRSRLNGSFDDTHIGRAVPDLVLRVIEDNDRGG